MSPTRRGGIIFIIMIVAAIGCCVISFGVMPNLGIAVGLPVITVPGEAYNGALPSNEFNFTNTLMGTLLADLMVLIFVILAIRATRNFRREVPTRFGALVELIGDFVYGQTKAFAGVRKMARWWLFPLAASIFVFLLAANWLKLFPGVESVGILHCAHVETTGYPSLNIGYEAYQLFVDQPLYPGLSQSAEGYEACEHFKEAGVKPSKDALEAASTALSAQIVAINDDESLSEDAKTAAVLNAQLAASQAVYPGASFALTPEDLQGGVIPYVQVVTPYVRGAATDLNLTIGLALIVVVAIQVFGVAAHGPDYFQKFINLRALGSLQKRPLGAVDFLVGLFEIVSELGKIISLAFRLFGNMFAGGILLAVMSFLVAFLLPTVFYGLEGIVTTIQAFVFAVLTLVFCAQAMESHHGPEGEDEHHHDEPPEQEPAVDLPDFT